VNDTEEERKEYLRLVEKSGLQISYDTDEFFHADELTATGKIHLERMTDSSIWGRITLETGMTIELGFFTDGDEDGAPVRFTAEAGDEA
jgi:hypothetical protein